MKALVTGGAGLIGSHIVDQLLHKGIQVRILDSLAKPTHLNGKPEWVSDDVEFMQGDVRSRDDLDQALQDVDWVFHQAADGGFTNQVTHYFTNNSLPTALMYELIRDHHPVKKVIVASSQAVYGEGKYLCPDHGPQYPPLRTAQQMQAGNWEVRCPECGQEMAGMPIDESHIDPITPYGMSKYWNEMIALQLGKRYQIPTTALRYSLTYGPRQSLYNPYTGICSIFSTLILNNKPPIIFEDGRQTRDFSFVEDVARANILVAEKEEANYQAYNVGTGVATSILDFVQALAAAYRRSVRFSLNNQFRPGDCRHLITDATRLRALGWEPQVSLAEGVSRYADWILKYGSIEEYFSTAEPSLRSNQVIMAVTPA